MNLNNETQEEQDEEKKDKTETIEIDAEGVNSIGDTAKHEETTEEKSNTDDTKPNNIEDVPAEYEIIDNERLRQSRRQRDIVINSKVENLLESEKRAAAN